MVKNWLIRTQGKQILGPVSKEKVIEFFEKGSLNSEDELMMGNGFWFSIKEQELLEKHLFGGVPQSFNPVSEAPSVLSNTTKKSNNKKTDQNLKIPAAEDLEYPSMATENNMNSSTTEITQVMSLKNLRSSMENVEEDIEDVGTGILPDDKDLEYPEMPKEDKIEEVVKSEPKKVKERNIGKDRQEVLKSKKDLLKNSSREVTVKSNSKKQQNDTYLFYILFIVFLILAGIFFYYKKVLNRPLPFFSMNSILFPVAHAQTIESSLVKKKTFLTFKI